MQTRRLIWLTVIHLVLSAVCSKGVASACTPLRTFNAFFALLLVPYRYSQPHRRGSKGVRCAAARQAAPPALQTRYDAYIKRAQGQ